MDRIDRHKPSKAYRMQWLFHNTFLSLFSLQNHINDYFLMTPALEKIINGGFPFGAKCHARDFFLLSSKLTSTTN